MVRTEAYLADRGSDSPGRVRNGLRDQLATLFGGHGAIAGLTATKRARNPARKPQSWRPISYCGLAVTHADASAPFSSYESLGTDTAALGE